MNKIQRKEDKNDICRAMWLRSFCAFYTISVTFFLFLAFTFALFLLELFSLKKKKLKRNCNFFLLFYLWWLFFSLFCFLLYHFLLYILPYSFSSFFYLATLKLFFWLLSSVFKLVAVCWRCLNIYLNFRYKNIYKK